MRTLIQQEVRLAKTELSEQVKPLSRGAIWGAVATVLGVVAVGFAFGTLMWGLAEFMDLWLASLITTGVIVVLAAIAGFAAMKRFKQVRLAPERTMRSVKEDIEWARSQLTSNGK
jgi:hypothetical protein